MAEMTKNGSSCGSRSTRSGRGLAAGHPRTAAGPWVGRLLGGIALASLVLLGASPVGAAVSSGAASRIAGTELSGTHLTVSPEIAFDRASLRVVGPAGYEAIAWSAGEALSLDLLRAGRVSASDGQPGGRPSVLPDGRYGYEVVLYLADGQRRFASGAFRVENGFVRRVGDRPDDAPGSASGPAAGPQGTATGDISTKSGSTGEIYLINDTDDDGEANLQITSHTGAGDLINYWGVRNQSGDLRLSTSGGLDWDDQVTVKASGRVGIGTVVPGAELDVRGLAGAVHITDTDACPNPNASWDIEEDYGKLKFGVLANCTGDQVGGKMWITGAGNVGIGTLNPAAKLHVVGSGIIEGDVAFGSSRTIKHEIKPVDGEQVLAELRELSVYSWKYIDDPDQADHVGPMAEDVHETFGLGRDGHHLSPADSAGLALAAVRGLDREMEALRARNQELAAENDGLRQRLDRIEERLGSGAGAAESPAP